MKNTTRYAVIASPTDAPAFAAEIGITKKAKAVEAARTLRDENAVSVTVVSVATGNVVFEQAAPKKIKMSAPYTREVDPGDQINGKRVAYLRKRVGFALLDANKIEGENGVYSIYDLTRGIELDAETVEVRTTRDAGRWFADEAPALRASLTNA